MNVDKLVEIYYMVDEFLNSVVMKYFVYLVCSLYYIFKS